MSGPLGERGDARGGGSLTFKKKNREQNRKLMENGGWEERQGGKKLCSREKENAGNRREGKIGLGDMFKRVRRRWIRGGVE